MKFINFIKKYNIPSNFIINYKNKNKFNIHKKNYYFFFFSIIFYIFKNISFSILILFINK